MAKRFKVFLSSSFQDMHEERDYLKYHSFAALQAEMFIKGWDFQILDLRGTTTQPDLSQEEAVLRLCLDGVDDCVPRMVVLLGDRYGWIPYGEGAQYPDEEAKNRSELSVQNINDAPNLDITTDEIAGRSVTHLEIYYGLKHMPHDEIFFYNRNGLPYESMTDEQRTVFCSGYESQKRLKTEIHEKMKDTPQNIRDYKVSWDASNGKVTGLKELDAMIYADLKASFEKELAKEQPEENTAIRESQEILTSLALSTLKWDSLGNPDSSDEFLDVLIDIIQKRGFFWVTGEHGSGVTTYIAQIYHCLVHHRDWRKSHNERPMFIIGYTPDSHIGDISLYALLIELLCQTESEIYELISKDEEEDLDNAINASIALSKDYSDNREDTSKNEAAIEAMSGVLIRFLEILREKYDVFIVLSDIDMLFDSNRDNKTLYWLDGIPSDVAVVFSAVEDSLTPFMQHKVIRVPELDAELIRLIMTNTARDYGKRFSEEILELATQKFLSSGYATALDVRTLSEGLMNMTGSDYLAFTGPDAHLTFMKSLINGLDENIYGVFNVLINRAIQAYGDLALAALRLLWLSRTLIPDSIFHETLSLYLGREVSTLELFSLKGYLKSNLKQSGDTVVWQLAHKSFRDALVMRVGSNVRDLADSMLHVLRKYMSDNPFILSEFLWYGYWADDPSAVSEYVDTFSDNNTAWNSMFQLFRTNLKHTEGDWFSYLEKACEPLRNAPDGLITLFFRLIVLSPDEEDDFKSYDSLMNKILSVADDVLPEDVAAELHPHYAGWLLRSKYICDDENTYTEALLQLEASSFKASEQFDPDKADEVGRWYYYMSEILNAQLMLCNIYLLDKPGLANVWSERAYTTFLKLGDDGAGYLIESGNKTFLSILRNYLPLLINDNFDTQTVSDKLDLYIDLVEKQNQNDDIQKTLFSMYSAAIEVLDTTQTGPQLNEDYEYIPDENDERLFGYLNKLILLGEEMYTKSFMDEGFLNTYLKYILELARQQGLRKNYEAAFRANWKYLDITLTLHSNNILSDEQIISFPIYKAAKDYAYNVLNVNQESWREQTDYLEGLTNWLESLHPDPLLLTIRRLSNNLMKLNYSSTDEDFDEKENGQFFTDALELAHQLPVLFSDSISDGLSEGDCNNLAMDILLLLPDLFGETIKRDMPVASDRVLDIFDRMCPLFLESKFTEDVENTIEQTKTGYGTALKERKDLSRRLGLEVVIALINSMEDWLEPRHKALNKQLSDIRKAVE